MSILTIQLYVCNADNLGGFKVSKALTNDVYVMLCQSANQRTSWVLAGLIALSKRLSLPAQYMEDVVHIHQRVATSTLLQLDPRNYFSPCYCFYYQALTFSGHWFTPSALISKVAHSSGRLAKALMSFLSVLVSGCLQSPPTKVNLINPIFQADLTTAGQPGTGILWITDVDSGLKAYKTVPDSTGNLVRLNIPPTGGLNKFQRPGFGDGRLYVTGEQELYLLGCQRQFSGWLTSFRLQCELDLHGIAGRSWLMILFPCSHRAVSLVASFGRVTKTGR